MVVGRPSAAAYKETKTQQAVAGVGGVKSMNATLRGWWNYFHYRNSSQALGKVKTHVEERLRTHLMNRHKVKDRGTGIGRFPSREFYTRLGLYKVPTTAGWKTAHALV